MFMRRKVEYNSSPAKIFLFHQKYWLNTWVHTSLQKISIMCWNLLRDQRNAGQNLTLLVINCVIENAKEFFAKMSKNVQIVLNLKKWCTVINPNSRRDLISISSEHEFFMSAMSFAVIITGWMNLYKKKFKKFLIFE